MQSYCKRDNTAFSLAAAANENDKAEEDVEFKHNLLEYSQNYSITSGSLWNYYRDEIDDVDEMLQMVNYLNIKQK